MLALFQSYFANLLILAVVTFHLDYCSAVLGLPLEDHPTAAAGPECSRMQSSGCPVVCLIYITVA